MVEPERNKLSPPWLYPLLRTTLFFPCTYHSNSSKKECNIYCLDCTNGVMCSSCLIHNSDHRSIHIRRSSYHDVIRVSEINKFLDLSGVRTYIINGAKVVFLSERPRQRVEKAWPTLVVTVKGVLLTLSTSDLWGVGWQELQIQQILVKGQMSTQSSKQTGLIMTSHLIAFHPATPPATTVTNKMAKRRKGISHRTPMGVC